LFLKDLYPEKKVADDAAKGTTPLSVNGKGTKPGDPQSLIGMI